MKTIEVVASAKIREVHLSIDVPDDASDSAIEYAIEQELGEAIGETERVSDLNGVEVTWYSIQKKTFSVDVTVEMDVEAPDEESVRKRLEEFIDAAELCDQDHVFTLLTSRISVREV